MAAFGTGLEPLLEKLGMEQLPLPLGNPAPPGGGIFARGGRMLQNAAQHGMASAGKAFSGLPRAGKFGLGAAAALGAGGLAYGALKQHEDDARQLSQIYTPMSGSIYG